MFVVAPRIPTTTEPNLGSKDVKDLGVDSESTAILLGRDCEFAAGSTQPEALAEFLVAERTDRTLCDTFRRLLTWSPSAPSCGCFCRRLSSALEGRALRGGSSCRARFGA